MTQSAAPADPLEPDPRVLAWQALAEELTPARSLARIDAATGRVLTSVTVVGTVLTGLGLVAATQVARNGLSQALALAAVIVSVLAVAAALAAQVLTVRRGLNTNDLVAVREWYRSQFRRRAYPARAAGVLLLVAVLLSAGAAVAALVGPARTTTSLAVSATGPASGPEPGTVSVTVEVGFSGLAEGSTATVLVTGGRSGGAAVLARAAVTPGPDGAATRTLVIPEVPGDAVLEVRAQGGPRRCHAVLDLGGREPPAVTCGETSSG